MISGSHITVVSQYYWPEHVGIAPYSTRLAEHLVECGAHVEVVTAMPHYPAWRIESQYRRLRMREERAGVVVNRLWHYIPPRQSALRRAAYEASFVVHAGTKRAPKADAVIGVIPSLSAGVMARTYARRRGCAYGIVVQDLSAQAARQSGITKLGAVGKVTSAVERWVLSEAARVAVVSERFQPHVEAAGVSPQSISVLRNWVEVDTSSLTAPAAAEAAERRRELGWRDDEQIVLHAGNMGLKQGLEFVVDAARLASDRGQKVRFVLMGDGSQRPMIERRADGLATLQFLPNLPRDECNEVMAVADVLLVNERGSIVDMALPSKLTSYFAAARPVVAAVTDDGTTAQEIRRAGGGVVVAPEDPDALLGALSRLAADPALAADLSAKGSAYAERELSATAILQKAEEFVRGILEVSRPSASG
jgi:glycosyltransferase involved in cell wall biosynthesis